MSDTPRASTIDRIGLALLKTRPYGGTPIAASLDDVRALFERDPWMEAERQRPRSARHVILITDGRPDDDHRAANCDCNEGDKNCADYLLPTERAADMHCPYPRPEAAARALRCGDSDDCTAGSVADVHVIGFDMEGAPIATADANDIAKDGGTSRALFASTAEGVRRAVASILDDILRSQGNRI